MMKKEFEKLAGITVSENVYRRIEAEYMSNDLNKQDWYKRFGKGGVIQCYAQALADKDGKLDRFARRAIEAYDRCHSSELLDENGRVTDYDLWGRLMAVWSAACDALDIDEYKLGARDLMFMRYVII